MEAMLLDLISIETIIQFLVILFFSFIGSFAKNYLSLLQNPSGGRFNFIEITLSTFTASIIVFSFSSYIINIFTFKGIVLCAFLIGLVGFELLTTLSSLQGLIHVIDACVTFYLRASESVRESDEDNNN